MPLIRSSTASSGSAPGGTLAQVNFRIEEPLEAPDGVSNIFTLPDNFLGTSVLVFHNGLTNLKSNLLELPPNQVELGFVPAEGDELQFMYLVA